MRKHHVWILAALLGASATGCAKTAEEWRDELSDPDPFARELAALSALDLDPEGSTAALPMLLEIFDSGDACLRAPAVRVLAHAAPACVPALLEHFTQDDGASPEWHKACGDGLVAAGASAVAPLFEAMRSPGKSNARELGFLLVRIGAPALAGLRSELRERTQPSERALAALLLGRMGLVAAAAESDLEHALESDVALVAGLAAESLAQVDPRGERCAPALEHAAEHAESNVRISAARALASVRLARGGAGVRELAPLHSAAWPACVRALAGKDAEAQHTAFSLLSSGVLLGWTDQAAPAALNRLHNELPEERGCAALNLGAGGARELVALPLLFDAAHDKHAGVRWCAALALASIGRDRAWIALASRPRTGTGR